MTDYEDNQEEENNSVQSDDDVDSQQAAQPNVEEIKLQNDLAKELKDTLKIPVTDSLPDTGPSPYKVAIVGMNELGSATAFLLICKQVVTDVILIDRNAKRLAAEYADLSTCTTFVSGVNVQASNQLASCEGVRVVIVCDVSESDEESLAGKQLSSQEANIFTNFKKISRAISLYAPDCVMIVAVQPFEMMTHLCALNSILPSHRILAPGTMVDSAHFRLLIGEKLDVSPASITGIMLGGHGQNNMPLWNSVTVGGIHLLSENPALGHEQDRENWYKIHTDVNQRHEEIMKIKGTEVWSVAMASSELVECILRNKREIHPVTVNIKGYYNVEHDLFLSIPAIIGQNGVSHLITTKFDHRTETEFATVLKNLQLMVQKFFDNDQAKIEKDTAISTGKMQRR